MPETPTPLPPISTNESIKVSIWRALRIAAAMFIGTTAQTLTGHPDALWIAPVVAGLAKSLRLKYPGKFDWLPL